MSKTPVSDLTIASAGFIKFVGVDASINVLNFAQIVNAVNGGGSLGPTGPAGVDGAAGATGAAGAPGADGAVGATGAAGEMGPTGPSGSGGSGSGVSITYTDTDPTGTPQNAGTVLYDYTNLYISFGLGVDGGNTWGIIPFGSKA